MWLYIFGFIIHIIFFISVFDVYFHTPIIHGMEPQYSPIQPSAKRVVLIVADGLRADSLFNFTGEQTRAPFLRSLIEDEGTWGISHTHVPTESRPGHVAILAGIYEDPSAIAHGWRENPVHFDHILNQASHAWAYGSPDIVPMFAKGSNSEHISAESYTADEEDFASADASTLDTWVFNKVKNLFSRANTDSDLFQKLQSEKVIFFLHLLGLDTNGHSHKPHSEEYQSNIELVDRGVKELVQQFNQFYQDNQTAFVFTSDHGMTSWGSHGAGEASETETPLVVWGKGVAKPQDSASFKVQRMVFDSRVTQWGLTHVRRHDVHQADLAPLISSLVNIPIPVNNVGTLPVEFLSESAEYQAHALFANARQFLAQYRARRLAKQRAMLTFLFSPFKPLPMDGEVSYVTRIHNAINKKQYDKAIELSHSLIHLCEAGIHYFHNYHRHSLTLCITLSMLGWVTLVVSQIMQHDSAVIRVATNSLEGRKAAKRSPFWCCVVLAWGLLTLIANALQALPLQYHLYYLLPVVVWGVLVYRSLGVLRVVWLLLTSYNMLWETAIRLLALMLGVQILVLSFHARLVLVAGLVCLGVWPVILHSPQSPNGGGGGSLTLGWLGACTLLSSFSFLPPVLGLTPAYPMVIVSGLVGLVLGSFAMYSCGAGSPRLISVGSACQGAMVLISLLIVHTTSQSLWSRESVPLWSHALAWLVLGLSITVPVVCGSQFIMCRLLSIAVALLCPFILLSIRHEVFFFISLTIAMILWIMLEFFLSSQTAQIGALKFTTWATADLSSAPDRSLMWSDVRRAYFFLFFIVLAFFGIGNLASVNSFDPGFVYCFVTVFSPFTMGGLLLLKILIPFLLVTCFFHGICVLLQVPVTAVFQVFLVLSDLMALQFFLMIKTEGSWLTIGTSLSHFVISMSTTLFLYLLMGLAKVMTTVSLWANGEESAKQQRPVLPQTNRLRPHRD